MHIHPHKQDSRNDSDAFHTNCALQRGSIKLQLVCFDCGANVERSAPSGHRSSHHDTSTWTSQVIEVSVQCGVGQECTGSLE
jgi:hypothetical protein